MNKSSSHRKLKKMKKIKAKASKKRSYSSSNSSRSYSDSDASHSSDSDLEKERRNTECKDINELDHIETDNIKKNINQHNEAIENDPNYESQMNTEERTQLLRLLEYFEDLFDGNPWDWDTEPIDI